MTETVQPDPAPPPPPAPRRTSGMAIASLICGIVGLVFIPFIGPIVALVLGYQARKEIAANPNLDGEGLATAGIVLGWIGIGLILFVLLIFGCGAGTGGSGDGPYFSP